MAISFPQTPANGQVYTAPNGLRYVYTAARFEWKAYRQNVIGIPPKVPFQFSANLTPLAAHDEQTWDFVGNTTDTTITFPATLPAGWEVRYRRLGSSALYWAAATNATIVLVQASHTQAQPNGWFVASVSANSDGLHAVINIAGMTR